jgi:uncharacterized protein YfaQ (DUF2300 family)
MNTINSSSSDYLAFTQKLVKRNTATEIIEAKQSGTPVDKDQIQQSNQEIKDKSLNASLTAYQANITKNNIDTYIQSTQNANGSNSSDDDSDADIYTFDAKEVNDARSTVQKRAIGISVYENMQETK